MLVQTLFSFSFKKNSLKKTKIVQKQNEQDIINKVKSVMEDSREMCPVLENKVKPLSNQNISKDKTIEELTQKHTDIERKITLKEKYIELKKNT